MQTDFIALYRGQTVSEARLVALSADPEVVDRFIRELTGEKGDQHHDSERREPLRLIPSDEGE